MRVLLAIDESEQSEQASAWLRLCRSIDHLTVLHVIDIPPLTYQSLWLGMRDLPSIVEQAMEEQAGQLFERILPSLPVSQDRITTRVAKGHPAESIITVATEIEADLVLLGARGLTPLTERVLGSISHRVLLHSSRPTWVVKSKMVPVQRIVLPIEGLDDAKPVLTFLSTHPFGTQFEIVVLHVVPFSHPLWLEGSLVPEAYRQELVAAGKALNLSVISQLQAMGYHASSLVLTGSPSHIIGKQLSILDPEIVIFSSRSRHGLSRFVFGSVSHSLAHHAPHSLLLIR